LTIDSIKRTRRLIICPQECKTGSMIAAEMAAAVAEKAFHCLAAPIKRVDSPELLVYSAVPRR
jgi:pyruvate/2-oxoglutarate/acetoin dehydrogenase E1 component